MIWSVPEVVAALSNYVALAPGDLIFTGTPSGVGPLLRGDAMEGEIEGVVWCGRASCEDGRVS